MSRARLLSDKQSALFVRSERHRFSERKAYLRTTEMCLKLGSCHQSRLKMSRV